jgi:hypothetical protein
MGRSCTAERQNLLEFVLRSASAPVGDSCARELAPRLSGRVPTTDCGPSPENFYAWKLVLSKPWRVFADLQKGHPSFEASYCHLLNTYVL